MAFVDDIIEYLTGTCLTLDEATVEISGGEKDAASLPSADLSKIDSEIFCCDSCGWWFELSDMSEDAERVCIDCFEDV